jgi:hypothetical protein
MNNQKIYIHHPFSYQLFYKFFHNTGEIEFYIKDEKGIVTFNHNGLKYKVVFDENMTGKTDGYHLIDFLTYYIEDTEIDDRELNVYKKISKILQGKKNWIVSLMTTEKLLITETIQGLKYKNETKFYIEEILKNNFVISDNTIIRDSILPDYFKNLFFVFSNSIFNWNYFINIRWFYEFKSVYDKLNFDYDLAFSVRNPKPSRIEILKRLDALDNSKIFLQISDFIYQNKNFDLGDIDITLLNFVSNLKNVKINKLEGEYDFDNISFLSTWSHGIDFDLFFRYLSKSKIQILDESWSFSSTEYKTQYLSEKTIGYIMAGVPFIPTHTYPLEILNQTLDINPYPFFDEIKMIKGNPTKIVNFVEYFLKNFDYNYGLINEWTLDVHNKFIKKLNNENSFLNLLNSNFNIEIKYIKNSLI